MPKTQAEIDAFIDRAVDEGFSDEEIQSFLAEEAAAAPKFTPPPGITPGKPIETRRHGMFPNIIGDLIYDIPRIAKESTYDAGRMLLDLGNPETWPKILDLQTSDPHRFGSTNAAIAKTLGITENTVILARSVNPAQFITSMVMSVGQMASDVAMLATKSLVPDFLLPPGQGGESAPAHLESLLNETLAQTGLPAWQTLAAAYQEGGWGGLGKTLNEDPEIASAALLPVVLAGGAWVKARGTQVAFDSWLKQKTKEMNANRTLYWVDESRQARVARNKAQYIGAANAAREALVKEAQAAVDASARPAAAITTRLLVKVDPETGELRVRSVDEAFREEGIIPPDRNILTPSEASREAQLARLRDALNRLSVDPTGAPTPLNPQTHTPVVQRPLFPTGRLLSITEPGEVTPVTRPVGERVELRTPERTLAEALVGPREARSPGEVAEETSKGRPLNEIRERATVFDEGTKPTRVVTSTSVTRDKQSATRRITHPALTSDPTYPEPYVVPPLDPNRLAPESLGPPPGLPAPVRGRVIPAARTQEIVDATLAPNGGYSYSVLHDSSMAGQPYFAVGAYPQNSAAIGRDAFTGFDLGRFRKHNRNLLDRSGHVIGTWARDDGKIILDVVGLIPDRDLAINLARRANQEGIFDLKTMTYIEVGGTGEAMTLAEMKASGLVPKHTTAANLETVLAQTVESLHNGKIPAHFRKPGRMVKVEAKAKAEAAKSAPSPEAAQKGAAAVAEAAVRDVPAPPPTKPAPPAPPASPPGKAAPGAAQAQGGGKPRKTTLEREGLQVVPYGLEGVVRAAEASKAAAAPTSAQSTLIAAMRDASNPALKNPITEAEAAAVGRILTAGGEGAVETTARAIRTAVALKQPELVVDIFRRLARGEAKEPRPRTRTAPDVLADEVEAPAPAIDEATFRARLSQETGADRASIDDAVGRAFRNPGDKGIPFFDEAEGSASLGAAPKARQGRGLAALKSEASTKGLEVTIVEGEFVVSSPKSGLVAKTRSALEASDAIDAHKPPPPLKPPRKPRPKYRPTDAGFLGLNQAWDAVTDGLDALYKKVLDGQLSPEAFAAIRHRAAEIVDGLLLRRYTTTPAQLAKELPGRTSWGLLNETVGNNIFGRFFKANAELLAEGGKFRAFMDEGAAWGFKENSKAALGAGEILDTFNLTYLDDADNAFKSLAHDRTPSGRLIVASREEITAAQIARASEAWDALTPEQRRWLLKFDQMKTETFYKAQAADAKGQLFTVLHEAGPGAEVRTVGGIRIPRKPLIDLPETELGPKVHGVRPAFRLRTGPRISGYITHGLLEDLRNGTLLSDLETMAPPNIRAYLATDVPRAFGASPTHPYIPSDSPNLVFIDKAAALRHLFPGIPNTDLARLIHDIAIAVDDAQGNADRVAREIPTHIMSRFLAARRGKDRPPQIDLVKFANAYFPRVMAKTIFDPVLAQTAPDIASITDPALQQATKTAVANIIGSKPALGTAGRFASHLINYATSLAYYGTLPAKPFLAAINTTQIPLFQQRELGVRNFLPSQRLLASGEFWTWLLEERLLHESMPLDHFVRFNRPFSPKEAFSAVRGVENFVDSFRLMQEAKTPESAKQAVEAAIKAGVNGADFLAMAETYIRASTMAHSIMNTLVEHGLERYAKQGKMSQLLLDNPALYEHMKRKAYLDSARVNFFVGRGANAPIWQGMLQRTKAGTPLRPAFMFTSYPTGAFAAVSQWLKDSIDGPTKAARRQGRFALFNLFGAMTAIAGPYAVFAWVDRIDEESGAKGKLQVAFDEWERNYSLAGLIAASTNGEIPNLAERIGVTNINPIPYDVDTKPVVKGFTDAVIAGSAIARHYTSGGAPTPEQEDAIQRWFGGTFDWVSKPGREGMPEDLAIFVPLAGGARQAADALNAANNYASAPQAVVDDKGRPMFLRESSERILRYFRGRSVAEAESGLKAAALEKRDARLSELRQRLTRHTAAAFTPEGVSVEDRGRFLSAMQEINKSYPDFNWSEFYDGFLASVKNEALKQRMTRIERLVFDELSTTESTRVLKNALASLQPGTVETLSPAQLAEAQAIVLAGRRRAFRRARR